MRYALIIIFLPLLSLILHFNETFRRLRERLWCRAGDISSFRRVTLTSAVLSPSGRPPSDALQSLYGRHTSARGLVTKCLNSYSGQWFIGVVFGGLSMYACVELILSCYFIANNKFLERIWNVLNANYEQLLVGNTDGGHCESACLLKTWLQDFQVIFSENTGSVIGTIEKVVIQNCFFFTTLLFITLF